MKLGLIFGSAVFGMFLGTGIALATTAHTVVAEAPIHVAADKTFAVELPQSDVLTVGEVTITAKRPVKVASAKVWSCGPMQDLATGGRARTCEWR